MVRNPNRSHPPYETALSGIYDEGIEQAIAKLEDPDRIKRHDPALLFRKVGLKSGMSVADLGCGTGFFTLPAAGIVGANGHVYAVDKVPDVLEVLKAKLRDGNVRNVRVIQADVASTQLEPGSVQMVLMANIFHDVRERSLDEVERILKPGGKLVVLEWRPIATPHGPPLDLRLSPQELTKIIEVRGFRVKQEFEIGSWHYVVVAS